MPGTGFEPAHPFERCHLKAVRLPISPPGLTQVSPPGLFLWAGCKNIGFGVKNKKLFEGIQFTTEGPEVGTESTEDYLNLQPLPIIEQFILSRNLSSIIIPSLNARAIFDYFFTPAELFPIQNSTFNIQHFKQASGCIPVNRFHQPSPAPQNHLPDEFYPHHPWQ